MISSGSFLWRNVLWSDSIRYLEGGQRNAVRPFLSITTTSTAGGYLYYNKISLSQNGRLICAITKFKEIQNTILYLQNLLTEFGHKQKQNILPFLHKAWIDIIFYVGDIFKKKKSFGPLKNIISHWISDILLKF